MNDAICENAILSKLQEIFAERFALDLNNYTEQDFERSLLSKTFRLSGRDLVYLFYDVEKVFKIEIPEKDILQGNFSSINQITNIIQKVSGL